MEILSNAVICTLDRQRPWSTSMAVGADGRILAVGAAGAIGEDAGWHGTATRVRDMRGAFVLPGLVDVHNHHALAGHEHAQLRLPAGASLDDIVATVRGSVRDKEPGEWVTGGSWDSTLLRTLAGPAALSALDQAADRNPVLLIDDSRHNRLANSRALELAGLRAESGLLLEADGLRAERARLAAAPPSEQQHMEASREAIATLHAHGITAFQDAGVSTTIMRALKALDDAAELHAWVVTSMLVNDQIFGFEPVGAELIKQGEQYRTAHHRPDFVKIFLDGTPPAHTAAFLDGTGSTTMDEAELTGWLRRAGEAGLSAKIHCAGDDAVRMVLDSVQRLKDRRPPIVQIAHGQFIAPADLPRFAKLGVTADISPFLWMPGVIPAAIASVRPADRMQPNRSLLDAGALVAGGSDWPVSPEPDLWHGIQGLVTRQDPAGEHPGALWPEQAITLAEAIAVFTRNAAEAMGLGQITGSLEPGKSADYVVLDRNPFSADVADIAKTSVLETVFAGRRVYEKS